MKLNLLKGFAAVAMLCMIGAVFAESVAVGDIGYYLTEKYGAAGSASSSVLGYVLPKVGARLGKAAMLRFMIVGAEEGAEAGALAGPIGAGLGTLAGLAVAGA